MVDSNKIIWFNEKQKDQELDSKNLAIITNKYPSKYRNIGTNQWMNQRNNPTYIYIESNIYRICIYIYIYREYIYIYIHIYIIYIHM